MRQVFLFIFSIYHCIIFHCQCRIIVKNDNDKKSIKISRPLEATEPRYNKWQSSSGTEAPILLFHYSNTCNLCKIPKEFVNNIKYDQEVLNVWQTENTELVRKITNEPATGVPMFYLLRKGEECKVYQGADTKEAYQVWLDSELAKRN